MSKPYTWYTTHKKHSRKKHRKHHRYTSIFTDMTKEQKIAMLNQGFVYIVTDVSWGGDLLPPEKDH